MHFSRNKIIALGLETVGLIVVSIALVLGFYYHSYFYEIYTPLLFIGGAVIIVLMIWTIVWLRKERKFGHKTKGVMIFEPEEKEKIMSGMMTEVVYIDHVNNYSMGVNYDAKMNITAKSGFATLKVVDIDHLMLKDLKELNYMRLGFGSKKKFTRWWKRKYGSYESRTDVTLLTIKILED